MNAAPHTPITIHVWTDFVCPFCLLGERIIEEATESSPMQRAKLGESTLP
ncbi:MAG TPA: hypothetical protein VFV57_05670 [Limnobacter sp.]|nr:hypothetical protein [Limnobacter sp.]